MVTVRIFSEDLVKVPPTQRLARLFAGAIGADCNLEPVTAGGISVGTSSRRSQRAIVSDRQKEALRLEKIGCKPPEIARILGIRRQSAYRLLRKANAAVDEVRRLAAEFA